MADEAHDIAFTLNGERVALRVPARVNLADLIRGTLNQTGTHVGCEHGVCGACNLMLDGRSVRSCLMLAVQADGAEIQTIEGLTQSGIIAARSGCARRPLMGKFSTARAVCTP